MINYRQARQYLEAFDFKKLFVEVLGWSRPTERARFAPIEVEGEHYRLTPIAELGGMVVFVCEDQSGGEVPEAARRKQIDKRVSELAFEHILIFVDGARTQAVWQWVKREAKQSAKARQHTYTKGQPGDSLLHKLGGIAFDLNELDDDGQVSIATVVGKVAKQFDVDRVTKRFYDEFKGEHEALAKAIKGLDAAPDREWYALVTLNRLMFIYFIQKQGYLDGNERYLPQRLQASEARGADRFYRDFLKPLFFEGFALEVDLRPIATRQLIGRVPYLNGGLFMPHRLEVDHGVPPSPALPPSATGEGGIHIPDASFKRLFAFFDRYAWQLDDRPLRADNEINPDVLGFIFEKYINQKLMGAYYTKEDITGYICRNAILPFLFDKVGRLRYEAVHPFPLRDVEPYLYAALTQAEYLPTETDREYAARQSRVAHIRADFAAGKISGINDLITYNLDIERFMQDWLRALDDPLTLRTFYFECLKKLTVLDPTVGSGAFLFAAMNIVEPLYEICLDKIERFAADRRIGPKYPEFQAELARVAAHPNRCYFIFKSIIVNNLYGVDIMEEAVEICKLRLFLKLVSQISDADHIEPLPDIDFNIVPGNTLVGYASLAEVEQAASRSLFNLNLPQRITEADVALRAFRDLQTQIGISARVLAQAKADTKAKLSEIEAELNESLRVEYGAKKLEKFVESHRPFHWYVKFNTIMQDGGFDVVAGNPPYVEINTVSDYGVRGFQTESCGDLYAYVVERAYALLKVEGRLGVIVPISIFGTDGFEPLQQLSLKRLDPVWISCFANRPSQLFSGAQKRLTVMIGKRETAAAPQVYTTGYLRWLKDERDALFPSRLQYSARRTAFSVFPASLEKLGDDLEVPLFARIIAKRETLADGVLDSSSHKVYYTRKFGYFLAFLNFIPRIIEIRTGQTQLPSELKELCFSSPESARIAIAALSSTTFFWFWNVLSDCRNLNRRDLLAFRLNPESLPDDIRKRLADLGKEYLVALRSTSKTMTKSGLRIETFDYASCKPIIDEIDRVLARHYGFTDEELEFIINYDIKYRMGQEGKEE